MASDWDTLFDELYLTTYAPHLAERDSEAEALGAVRLAGVEPGADVLDAPCGFGRHSLPLARAGYRVVGVDRSEVQLREARRQAADAQWPRFVQGDLRELPLAGDSFDTALCLFTSIGYRGEEGDRQMLAEFRRVLRPEGTLVIETMHRDRLVSILQERGWEDLPEGGLLIERRRFDQVAGVMAVTHMLLPAEGERRSVSYECRLYTATELVRLVQEAGFGEIRCAGGFDAEPLTLTSRLVVVARAGT